MNCIYCGCHESYGNECTNKSYARCPVLSYITCDDSDIYEYLEFRIDIHDKIKDIFVTFECCIYDRYNLKLENKYNKNNTYLIKISPVKKDKEQIDLLINFSKSFIIKNIENECLQ